MLWAAFFLTFFIGLGLGWSGGTHHGYTEGFEDGGKVARHEQDTPLRLADRWAAENPHPTSATSEPSPESQNGNTTYSSESSPLGRTSEMIVWVLAHLIGT